MCVYIIIAAWCNLHSHSYHHHDQTNNNNCNDDDIKSKCTYQDKRQFSRIEIESFEFVELPNGCRCFIRHSIIWVLNFEIFTIYYCCCFMHFQIACKILTHTNTKYWLEKSFHFLNFIGRMKFMFRSSKHKDYLNIIITHCGVCPSHSTDFYYSAPPHRRDFCPQLPLELCVCVRLCVAWQNVLSVIFPSFEYCLAAQFLWDASVCSPIDNLIQYYYCIYIHRVHNSIYYWLFW